MPSFLSRILAVAWAAATVLSLAAASSWATAGHDGIASSCVLAAIGEACVTGIMVREVRAAGRGTTR